MASINNNDSAKGFLFGFLAGGATGAIVALLTAPKNGKELRGDIKQKSGEYLDKSNKYFQETKIKAGEMLTEGKRKYATMINDAKIKTKDVLHSGKEILDTETERLKDSVKAGMDAYNENKKS